MAKNSNLTENLTEEISEPFNMFNQINNSDSGEQNDGAESEDELEDDDDNLEEGEFDIQDFDEDGEIEATENDNTPSNKKPIAIFAEQWIADGRLPSDFKITDDLTEEDIDKALYEHKAKLLVESGIQDYIKDQGLTEDEINQLRGQKLNIDPTLYKNLKAYNTLANLEFSDTTEDLDENEAKDLRIFLEYYYKDINFPEHKIKKQIDSDIDDNGERNTTIKEAKKHFSNKESSIRTKIETIEKDKAKENSDKTQARIDKEKSILNSKKISNRDFTDEEIKFISKALFEKSEIINVGGKSIKATLYEKKIAEATQDPEKALLTKALFVLDEFKDSSPEEKAGKNILKQLSSAISNNKIVKNKITKNNDAMIEIL